MSCHVYIWIFSNNINYINIVKFSSLSSAIIAKFNWGQNSTSLGTKIEHKENQENVYLATTGKPYFVTQESNAFMLSKRGYSS